MLYRQKKKKNSSLQLGNCLEHCNCVTIFKKLIINADNHATLVSTNCCRYVCKANSRHKDVNFRDVSLWSTMYLEDIMDGCKLQKKIYMLPEREGNVSLALMYRINA